MTLLILSYYIQDRYQCLSLTHKFSPCFTISRSEPPDYFGAIKFVSPFANEELLIPFQQNAQEQRLR